MNSNKLSVTIITKNEEFNIAKCLNSVSWADEIVVVDSGSTDNTLNICQDFKCKIIQSDWLGFGKTKQLAVDSASNDWILSVDADEELTPALQKEIQSLSVCSYNNIAYRIRRNSFYLGKLIRYCGWQFDAPLRLFNREMSRFNDKPVHESVVTKQPVAILKNSMNHYTYPTIESHFKKMEFYGEIAAQQMLTKGKGSNLLYAYLRALVKFIKMYFLQFGLLDGVIGFKLCKNSAYGVWYKYKRLRDLRR